MTSKGESTRQTILDAGLAVASRVGLEDLTIGGLADRVGLSKSGLFAHFNSKEALQLEVLRTAVQRFRDRAVRPALEHPPGEPRVRAMFEAWLDWTRASALPGGCVFISSAAEFDDRPGPIREFLVTIQREWSGALQRAARLAIEEGHFRDDLDPRQFVFDLHSIILSYHYFDRLLDDPVAESRARRAFDRLLERARA